MRRRQLFADWRRGYGELRVTVPSYSQPKSWRRAEGSSSTGARLRGCPGPSAAGSPAPGPVQHRAQPHTGPGPPGGRRRPEETKPRRAPLRPEQDHGCPSGARSAAGRRGAELLLLPAVLYRARAAGELQPQLLPVLHRHLLQGEAARPLPALPGGLRAEGPAAQPGAGRPGQPGAGRGKGRGAGGVGPVHSLWRWCRRWMQLCVAATRGEGRGGGGRGFPPSWVPVWEGSCGSG